MNNNDFFNNNFFKNDPSELFKDLGNKYTINFHQEHFLLIFMIKMTLMY